MRKNELRKNIIFALIMVVVAAVSLATATYSWFVSQSKAQVSQVEFSAQGSYGMNIAVPQNNAQIINGFHSDLAYKGLVDEVDIAAYLDNTVGINNVKRQLQAVSTVNTQNFFMMTQFDGAERKGKSFSNVSTTFLSNLKPYLELPIYVLGNDDSDIYLRQWETALGGSTVLNGTVVKGIAGANALGEEIDKALRIAFVPARIVAGAVVKDYSSAIIYEPNPNVGTIHTNSTLYVEGVGESIKDSGIETIDSSGHIATIKKQNKFTDELIVKTESNAIIKKPSALLDGKKKVFSIKSGEPALVYIYVWLEGNDYECLSYITYGTANINLSFIAAN